MKLYSTWTHDTLAAVRQLGIFTFSRCMIINPLFYLSRVRKSQLAPLLPPSPSIPTLKYFASSSAPAPIASTHPNQEPVSSSTVICTVTQFSSQPATTMTAIWEALPCQYISFFSRPTTIESVFPTLLYIPPEKPKFSPYVLPTFISHGHPAWLHLCLDFRPQLSSILLAQCALASLFRSSFTLTCHSVYFFSNFPMQSCSCSLPLSPTAHCLSVHTSHLSPKRFYHSCLNSFPSIKLNALRGVAHGHLFAL